MANEQLRLDQNAERASVELLRNLRLLKEAVEAELAADRQAARALCERRIPGVLERLSPEQRDSLKTVQLLALLDEHLADGVRTSYVTQSGSDPIGRGGGQSGPGEFEFAPGRDPGAAATQLDTRQIRALLAERDALAAEVETLHHRLLVQDSQRLSQPTGSGHRSVANREATLSDPMASTHGSVRNMEATPSGATPPTGIVAPADRPHDAMLSVSGDHTPTIQRHNSGATSRSDYERHSHPVQSEPARPSARSGNGRAGDTVESVSLDPMPSVPNSDGVSEAAIHADQRTDQTGHTEAPTYLDEPPGHAALYPGHNAATNPSPTESGDNALRTSSQSVSAVPDDEASGEAAYLTALRTIGAGEYRWEVIRKQVGESKTLLLDLAPFTVSHRVTSPLPTYLIGLNVAGRAELHNRLNLDAAPGYLDRLVQHHGSPDIAHAVLWAMQFLEGADLFPARSVGPFKPALLAPSDGPILIWAEVPELREVIAFLQANDNRLSVITLTTDASRAVETRFTQAAEDHKPTRELRLTSVSELIGSRFNADNGTIWRTQRTLRSEA